MEIRKLVFLIFVVLLLAGLATALFALLLEAI